MKTPLIILALLLSYVSGNAQCAVSIAKSGTGTNRTYTATNLNGAPGMSYSWRIATWNLPTVNLTGSTVTLNYSYGGVYYVKMIGTASNGCVDSVTILDTVVGPPNCQSNNAYVSSNSSASVSLTANFSVYTGSTSYPGYYPSVASWNFGDGTTASGGQTATHTYATPGGYAVSAVVNWIQNGTNNIGCSKTVTGYVSVYKIVTPSNFSCDSLSTSLSTAVGSLNNVNVSWSYSYNGVANGPASTKLLGITKQINYDFGDGSSASGYGNTYHQYTTAGTYVIRSIAILTDSILQNIICIDTAYQTVQATGNIISGRIFTDTLAGIYSYDSFKVWLVQYDSLAATLSAIDSIVVAGYKSVAFSFGGKPAGNYRVKAQQLNTPYSPQLSYLPTYGDSSLFWNTANAFPHYGGVASGKNIYMRVGTAPSGPGFIAGSVLQGANKGTTAGAPVSGLTILLRNGSGKVVAYTTTNNTGQYSFSNISQGAGYTVYPEAINYVTTPSAAVNISGFQPTANGINFVQTGDGRILPKVTAGIPNAESDFQITVSPNPTTGVVGLLSAVSHKYMRIVVNNIAGQTVYTKTKFNIERGQTATIDISGQPEGVYQLTLEADQALSSYRIVLQR